MAMKFLFSALFVTYLLHCANAGSRTKLQGKCPAYSGVICAILAVCSEEKENECSGQNKLCCFEGCDFVCRDPVYVQGYCPSAKEESLFTVISSACLTDGNCPGTKLCCSSLFKSKPVLVCKYPLLKKAECPPTPNTLCQSNIITECNGHYECIEKGQLCCSDGCKNVCTNPNFKEGKCPPQFEEPGCQPFSHQFCSYTADPACTEYGSICCADRCNSYCKEPVY